MPEQKQITLRINDREVVVTPGTLVIEATRRLGIEVPSFCYYPGLSLQAACRMCLVEVENAPKMQTACTLMAMEGMIVRTDTPQVHQARKAMLELLLTNHPLDCPVCDKGGECELQDMVFRYGADQSRFVEEKIHSPEEKWSELVYYDAPRCILCFRCVRVCDEGMDVKALGVGQRGAYSVIIPNREDHLECEECGMCIDICPVGALTSGTYRYKTRPWEMTYTATVCAHCSNGCKTTLGVRNNQILRANNRDLSGINRDFLCVKGRFGFDFTHHPDRLRQPLVQRYGKLEQASWEDALSEVARRLKHIQEAHGSASIGVIGSNRTTNEESYLLGRFARATLGTNNLDHHRTADYAGLFTALSDSAGARLATISELAGSRAFLLIGNDPTEQNPLVAWQIRSAKRHFGARLYVINSRLIKLRRVATHFAQIARGEEAAAVQWLATGKGNVSGDAAAALAALKVGLEKEVDVVILFGAEVVGSAISDLIAFGSSLPGRAKFMALGDYANSRGAADMGLLPDRLPGYALLGEAAVRDRFAGLWGARLSDKPGLDIGGMLDATRKGQLKALYVVGSNPAKTFGIPAEVLRKLELLVVHELFLTETAKHADVVFPASCLYEKDGTVTNMAGEVQLVRKAADAMATRSDFDILRILSHQLAKQGLGKAIHWRSPAAAFDEIRDAVPGYGVNLANLLAGGVEIAHPFLAPDGMRSYDVPAGAISSARDTLFTSGSLGRYCTMLNSVPEAAK